MKAANNQPAERDSFASSAFRRLAPGSRWGIVGVLGIIAIAIFQIHE